MKSSEEIVLELKEPYRKAVASIVRGKEGVEETLLEIYRAQAKSNPTIKRVQGSFRDSLETFEDIVPIPVELYKNSDMRAFDYSPAYTWHSSGTSGVVSRTPLSDPLMYTLAIANCLKGTEYEKSRKNIGRVVSLVPSAAQWKHSSLAYMFETLSKIKSQKRPSSWVVCESTSPGGVFLATEKIVRDLKKGEPIEVLTTSYMAVKLVDFMVENDLTLPEGSILVDTGGYKNVVEARSREQFIDEMSLIGLSPEQLFNEYGMSELSSHFWSEWVDGEELWKVPSWVRVKNLDPATMEEVDSWEDGALAIYDLANIWSSCAILTQDQAEIREVDGTTYLIPKGRVKGAVEKGCSYAAERAYRR